MSDEYTKRIMDGAKAAKEPMSEMAAQRLSEFNAKQSDWFAFCPKCSNRIQGTLKQLQEHTCGNEA